MNPIKNINCCFNNVNNGIDRPFVDYNNYEINCNGCVNDFLMDFNGSNNFSCRSNNNFYAVETHPVISNGANYHADPCWNGFENHEMRDCYCYNFGCEYNNFQDCNCNCVSLQQESQYHAAHQIQNQFPIDNRYDENCCVCNPNQSQSQSQPQSQPQQYSIQQWNSSSSVEHQNSDKNTTQMISEFSNYLNNRINYNEIIRNVNNNNCNNNCNINSNTNGNNDDDDKNGSNNVKRINSRRGSLPKQSVKILKNWLFLNFHNPYPTRNEKNILATMTGLSYSQVNYWFVNARVRIWRPIIDKQFRLGNKNLLSLASQRRFRNCKNNKK